MNTSSELQNENLMSDIIQQGHVPFIQGIPNVTGVSCYMSACIVSLCTSKKFVEIFGSQDLRVAAENDKFLHCFSKLMSSLFMNSGFNIRVNMNSFLDTFFKKSKENRNIFMRERQEDSSEFFSMMFIWLEEVLQSQRPRTILQNQIFQRAFTCLNEHFFNMRRETTCNNGHTLYKETNHEIMNLELNNGNVFSTLFEDFFREEILPDCLCAIDKRLCNAIFCSMCHKHVGVKWKETITYLPNTIIITIKLFDYADGRVGF